MSNSIVIEIPGLTRAAAIDLDRRADIAGAPFTFLPPRPSRLGAAERPSHVRMEDRREDPSIASETIDHPEGWPQDEAVREWLHRAIGFLGSNAPEQRFTFQAGWGDNKRTMTTDAIELAAFLETITAGALRADERYIVCRTV